MMLALSIRQPWAWLIVHGPKRIENREWPTRYRGPILIHASKWWSQAGVADTLNALADAGLVATPYANDQRELPGLVPSGRDRRLPRVPLMRVQEERGGIVGRAEIVDCVTSHGSPWFAGPFGFVLDKVEPVPFQPCPGALGLFRVADATESEPA